MAILYGSHYYKSVFKFGFWIPLQTRDNLPIPDDSECDIILDATDKALALKYVENACLVNGVMYFKVSGDYPYISHSDNYLDVFDRVPLLGLSYLSNDFPNSLQIVGDDFLDLIIKVYSHFENISFFLPSHTFFIRDIFDVIRRPPPYDYMYQSVSKLRAVFVSSFSPPCCQNLDYSPIIQLLKRN